MADADNIFDGAAESTRSPKRRRLHATKDEASPTTPPDDEPASVYQTTVIATTATQGPSVTRASHHKIEVRGHDIYARASSPSELPAKTPEGLAHGARPGDAQLPQLGPPRGIDDAIHSGDIDNDEAAATPGQASCTGSQPDAQTEAAPEHESQPGYVSSSSRDACADDAADEDTPRRTQVRDEQPLNALHAASPQLASSPPIASSPLPLPNPPEPSSVRTHYKPTLILRGHKRAVSAVRFSPDGRLLASSSADATCKIWDASTGAHMHTLSGHLAGISTLAWSPDSATLASGSDDKSIRLWHAATGAAHARPLLGHAHAVHSVAFSPRGNMLASGALDEAVVLWDARSGRALRSLPAHSDPVCGVDFCGDGTLVASCSADGLIRVWDAASGQCLRTFFHEDTPPVSSVRFAPNGRYVLAGMLDSALRMWNYVDGKCVKTYKGHVNAKFHLVAAFGVYGDEHRQQAFVASGSEDGHVVLWDVVSKHVLQRLHGHEGAVLAVDVHPKQRALVSCGFDKTIRIWRN